ncbi:MAG: Pls/PosA family non-ribosomal peptide synthetase [Legionellales bacterium]
MGSMLSNNSMQLHHFFEESVDNYPSNVALICDDIFLSYHELECRANQLAHYLLAQNISQGSIVGILLERSLDCYVSILALLKIGAAYVPIEVEYPDERINYILSDLPFQAVFISSTQKERVGLNLPLTLVLDEASTLIQAQPTNRPLLIESKGDHLCYIIYTSGSTGRPKGVEITHNSICHYVSVASDLYTMTPCDKVYHGFSLAFDASLEEVWMALANGAALVVCTDKDTRSGVGLLEFLQANKISVFSTVPTLLSSLDETTNDLRLLILGGEACAGNLVNRWMRPGLRIMNTYGPTEATVVATYSECAQDQDISIGKPLPGYKVLILDDALQPVADGLAGELCIGGKGLARGYVDSPDLTALKFIKNPLDQDSLLYRTGDLASISPSGDIQYLGRADDQIKLRGFRIELNEIEAVIMEYAAISHAVISLQQLEQPTLVAYLLIDKNSAFELSQFKIFLRSKLPDYMMPALFERVDAFPLLTSGKVDRKALPKPEQTIIETEYVAPASPLEKQIAAIWEASLPHGSISVTADFFYDLGGHSLFAAKVISNLRKIKEFETVSILDLYQNPTIRQLALKIEQDGSQVKSHEPKKETPRPKVSDRNYYLCGLGQFFGCLLQYGIGAWQFLAVYLCYAWLTEHQSYFSLESVTLYVALFLAMPVVSLALTVGVKWLLLGRIRPGEYPLWGWFYLRWWLVQGLQNNLFKTKYLTGTPLINLYYRLLGAKIGKDCYINTTNIAIPDMLVVGDGSTISNEVNLLGYIVEDGLLKIGTTVIGNDCYVGARSVVTINTILENNAVLDDMSMLPSGTIIGQNQFFTGSPARRAKAPSNHITQQQTSSLRSTVIQSINYGFLHYFALVIVLMLYYASFLPSIMMLDYFYENSGYLSTICIGAPLAAIVFLVIHYTNVCVSKKLIMRDIKPGTYPVNSFYYLRQWMILKIMDIDEIGVLADSLFFPVLLKLLGAKIGARVEMGEAPGLIPDFLTVEKGGFAASGVALAWPAAYRGYITFGCATIGKNAFVGNVSLLPQGTHIGEGGLLGCMTIPPSDNRASEANSYWLGSPPIYLPTREIIGGFPDSVTYNPSKRLYCLRLAIEFFRVVLPTTCTLILVCTVFAALEYLIANTSMLTTIVALPVVDLGINLIIVAGLVALKWLILGKIKPCIRPLWDVFIWKNDIREFTYNYYINLHLTDLILGTPFISILYRAMGAKIGKRAFINTEGFAEFDLITIGDDVCINKDSLIQTHLYEDRIFKLDHLLIKDRCNVGVGSMVLYNTVMEPNATLGSFSLLMKGECLPANTCWEGSPAQSSTLSRGLGIPVQLVESNEVPLQVPVDG